MDERLMNVEMKMEFLEKHVEDLDEVIREMNERLLSLGRKVERLSRDSQDSDEES